MIIFPGQDSLGSVAINVAVIVYSALVVYRLSRATTICCPANTAMFGEDLSWESLVLDQSVVLHPCLIKSEL